MNNTGKEEDIKEHDGDDAEDAEDGKRPRGDPDREAQMIRTINHLIRGGDISCLMNISKMNLGLNAYFEKRYEQEFYSETDFPGSGLIPYRTIDKIVGIVIVPKGDDRHSMRIDTDQTRLSQSQLKHIEKWFKPEGVFARIQK